MEDPQHGPELNPSEWELVKELVYQWEIDRPMNLNAWLADRCPTQAIRDEVERLVRGAATSGNFMQGKAAEEHLGLASHTPVSIGRYRVIKELGSGGLGVVYEAYDQSLERKVAIKVLADQNADPEHRKRLRWDARTASAARHPNIVSIYDIGNDGGLDYMVMECVEGQQLGKLLLGGLPVEKTLDYALQIAGALESAHRLGIVHRDLKPGNIMINEEGAVKILDFGLAKQEDPGFAHSSPPATIEGHFAGTVAYVSPEQAEGKPVDARGDIFSFGCILFEMLTGKQAFQGNTPFSVLGSILHLPAPVLRRAAPHSDERFEAIVQGCLKKKAAERFASMSEVKARLSEIAETGNSPSRFTRRTRTGLAYLTIGLALVAVAAVAGIFYWSNRGPAPYDQILMTTDTGLSSFPAISPDGRFIAYASNRAGKGDLDIYLQPWDQPNAERVALDAADESSPAFSSKGTELVYRSEQDGGGLYKVPITGGSPMRVAAKGRDGRFSPDGKWLAYWTGEIGGRLVTGSAQIYVIPATGGVARQFPSGFDAAAYPTWSATGNRIIFLGRKTGESKGNWWVADLESGSVYPTGMIEKLSKATVGFPLDSYFPVPAAWLPDGTVLFTGTSRDATNVWAVRVNRDGSAPDPPYHWTGGTDAEAYPAAVAMANGSIRTVYAALTTSNAIWQIPLNASGRQSGDVHPLITDFYRLGSPSLTSDGGELAFLSKQQTGNVLQLVKLDATRTVAPTVIARGSITRSVLSGDGRTVAWRDEQAGFVQSVKGDGPQQVCTNCGQPTHLSFDGKKAIFEAGRASGEDLLLCIRGQEPRILFQIQGAPHWLQSSGRFSPDEHWVAFSGWHEGDSKKQILVVPVTPDGAVAGSQVVEITHDDNSNREPVWSPDGRRIYFLSNRDLSDCVWACDVDPASKHPVGEPYPVAHFDSAGRAVRGPAANSGSVGLSAARDSLVLTLTESKGNIWAKATRLR